MNETRTASKIGPELTWAAMLLWPLGVVLAAYVIALVAVVVVPIITVALILYVAVPFYEEFFPSLSPWRRGFTFAGMVVAAFGPLAGAFLAVNPDARFDPARAAWIALVVGGAGLLLGAAGLLVGVFWRLQQYRLIEALPTSKIVSAAPGLVEFRGRARSVEPGRPILDIPFRIHPPVFLPGFWLEDESGKVWVEPGNVPVRSKTPRAFGFRINDVVLTRNSFTSNLGVPRRMALLDGDRVYLVGELREAAEREPSGKNALRVAPAVQDNAVRDYRHMFFLSDSSEDAALRHAARGMWRSWLLASIWIAAALAVMLHAAPRALREYDSWSLREVVTYVPQSQLIGVLVARWTSLPRERHAVTLAIAGRVQPPGAEGVFDILAPALDAFPVAERGLLFRGLGVLQNDVYRVVPRLVDGLQETDSRIAAGNALYAISGSRGFNSPQNLVITPFANTPADACVALEQFSKSWWALNLGGPIGVEILRRCPPDRRAAGISFVNERAYTMQPSGAPFVMRSLDAAGRRAVLRSLVFRTRPGPKLAGALVALAYDADAATAALGGAIAYQAHFALAATATPGLTEALSDENEDVVVAACRALRAVPALDANAHDALVAQGLNKADRVGREALLTLAMHEKEPARTKLVRLVEGGHVDSVRAMVRAEAITGLSPGSLPYGYSVTTSIHTARELRQLASLSGRPGATAYVQRQMVAALRSTDADLRFEAVLFYSQRRYFSVEAVEQLGNLLADPEARIRVRAADALLKLAAPPENIRDALERASLRNESGVGEAVRMILRRYEEPLPEGASIMPVESE